MILEQPRKLIYHVAMPAQLFRLDRDPHELDDVAAQEPATVHRLERLLRFRLNPEEIDSQAKADQQRMAERHGGTAAILERGEFAYTPPPGADPALSATQ